MNELKPERKKDLQEVQRLWIKYTEANCNFYLDPDGGTAARLAASEFHCRRGFRGPRLLEGTIGTADS